MRILPKKQQVKFDIYVDRGYRVMWYDRDGTVVLRPSTFIASEVVKIKTDGTISSY